MSFLSKLKISNVTNLSDARYAAAVGIDYIGFCFDTESENYIAPIKAKEMIDWLTGSNMVAEFGAQTLDEIKDISELLNVDAIEVNNRLLPEELKELDKAIIKKINVDAWSESELKNELQAYQLVCDAFHLFSSTNQPLTNEFAKELCATYKIIWGFEVTVNSIKQIITLHQPFAINVSGGVEEKVGIKDFDELNDLLEVITIED